MRLVGGMFVGVASAALGMVAVPSVALMAATQMLITQSAADRQVAVALAAPQSRPAVAQALDAADRTLRRNLFLAICGIMVVAFLLALAIAWSLCRRWAQPHLALLDASDQVAQGHLDGSFEETGARETRLVMRNLGRIARSFDRLETARRTWLVAISEELRRPVGALEQQIGALRGTETLPAEALDGLSDGVQRLCEMADDLQAVALADLGRLPVTFAPTDPRALIHNAIWANARRTAATGVTLDTSELPSMTVLVRWDAARIEQLFTALIESSLRYVPPGGRIALGLRAGRGAWKLTVDDSAPGVDVMLAQRLFEPFYRTQSEPGTSVTQSGLGLATAHAIVEAHHGRIEASRSPLGGLRVTVVLPEKPPIA